MTNNAFQNRVAKSPFGVNIMQAIGFVPDESHFLILNDFNSHLLSKAQNLIEIVLSTLWNLLSNNSIISFNLNFYSIL